MTKVYVLSEYSISKNIILGVYESLALACEAHKKHKEYLHSLADSVSLRAEGIEELFEISYQVYECELNSSELSLIAMMK